MVSKSFCVLLFVTILTTFASCQLTGPMKPIKEDTCHTKLSSCELDGKVEILGKPGITGPVGQKGDKGEPGSIGSTGKDGIRGKEGERGIKGDRGISGMSGLPGATGQKGDPGKEGEMGAEGEKGDKGNQALGPKGNMGSPGVSGICGCPVDPVPAANAVDTWATKEDPGQVPCKNAPDHKKHTVFYYLKDGIQVICNFATKRTCIRSNKHTTYFYKQNKPFWLSTENVTLKEIYDLESEQLSWLQKHSFVAELTIRFHCLNSKPVGSDPMVLLTWNDVKIGPEPTETSPFHYYVKYDFCSSAPEGKWSFTEIILVSPIAQRLPIIDFFIKDARYTDQALRIEIKSLCFG